MKNYFSSFRKRGISLLIALAMCMSMMPVNAFAADGEGAEPEAAAASAEATPAETISEASADDDVKIIVSDEPQTLDLDSSDVQTIDIDLTDAKDGGETSKDDADESDNLSEESGAPAALNEEDITSDTSDKADGTADPSDEGDGDPAALNEGDGTADTSDKADGETVEAEPEALAETDGETTDEPWDISMTERPDQTEEVTTTIGTEQISPDKDTSWEVFYDEKTGTYKLNFNINADADEAIQTFELSKALELLNQYAKEGNIAPKPDPGEKPVMPTYPTIPSKNFVEPSKPSEEEPKDFSPEALKEAEQLEKQIDEINQEIAALEEAPPAKSDELEALEQKHYPVDCSIPGNPPDPVREPIEPTPPTLPEPKEPPSTSLEDPGEAPGKPEGYDEKLAAADDAFLPAATEGSIWINTNTALTYLEEQGIDKNDPNAKIYARYLVEKGTALNHLAALDDPDTPQGDINYVLEWNSPSGYWDDNGNRVTYTKEERLEVARKNLQATISKPAPEYQVDKTTQEYKDWEQAKTAYQEYLDKIAEYEAYLEQNAAYELEMADFEKKQDQYKQDKDAYDEYCEALKAYNDNKKLYDAHIQQFPEYAAYRKLRDEYDTELNNYQSKLSEMKAELDKQETAWAAAKRQYESAQKSYAERLADYNAKWKTYEDNMDVYNEKLSVYNDKVNKLKADYEEAMAEYNAKVAEYQKKVSAYKAWSEANVLQPGDIRKFEFTFTSDSKHTYKYVNGSFTLATPEWATGNTSGVNGFDTQNLPENYVDYHDYYLNNDSRAIQDLLIAVGMRDPNHPYNVGYVKEDGTVNVMTDGKGNINRWAGYWDTTIENYLKQAYKHESVEDNLKAYLLDYFSTEDKTYTSYDELIQAHPEEIAELFVVNTPNNELFHLGSKNFIVDAHMTDFSYNHFYQALYSFAYGSSDDIDSFLGESKTFEDGNRFEYDNNSWTYNNYQKALAYYMAHEEIWHTTDAYFAALLEDGLSKEQATWVSFVMALNIDGEMTANDYQDTKWEIYNSIQLERMDIDFNLTKKDGETGEAIKDKTGFEIYYIEKVKNEDGTETTVNMYCTPSVDEDGNVSYTFTPTKSTVWTDENGNLKIDYAMMKDIVYYLKEVVAPEGYALDPNVYIVMSEEDYNNLSDEQKAELEGTFDAFLDMVKSEDGLTVNADFVNVKVKIVTPPIITTDEPDDDDDDEPTPEEPDDDEPTEVPDEPTPLMDVPDEEVPLTEIVEEDVPLTDISDEDVPLTDLFDEEVPLADVPMTGDSGIMMLCLALALCLGGVLLLKKREEA